MLIQNPKGVILIALIIAMALMSALGAGLYTLSTSSSYSEILSNNNDNAYELTQAGIRYAVGLHAPNFSATTFYLLDANNNYTHSFTISSANGVITSTGMVNQGKFMEAKRGSTYNASWAPLPSNIISFKDDMASFASPTTGRSQGSGGSPISVDMTNQAINMGGGINDGYGADWYQGSSIVGNCNQGVCSFGQGINVYFEFTFLDEDSSTDSTNSADGFTFAVISAIQNTRDRTGGSPSSTSNGEFVGYAGPDATTDKLGLKPPKMAIEFDTYPNSNGDICSSGSRNDHNGGATRTSFRDHVALLFWGDRTPTGGNCTVNGISYPRDSFDDNRHGAGGSGNDPVNSAWNDGTGGYYEFTGSSGRGYQCRSSANTCNWLEDGYKYNTRIEITRPSSPNGQGTYNYRVKAWVLSQNPNCYNPTGYILCLSSLTGLQQSHFQDVIVPYSDSSPIIDRTASLAQADHDNLSKIFFGFTEATGGSTQHVSLANLAVFFPQATCSYSISPDNAAYASAGGSGSVNVTTTTSCPWMANNASSTWITITSGSSGLGNGTVNYTVAPSAGTARTGYINIAGRTHTVTQASGCSYTISPSSASPGSGSGNGSFSVTAGTGCSWTATSDSTSWLTTSSSGSGNGTVNYSYTANTGPQRTGTITIGGQTFTVTQASGCTYTLNPTSASPGTGGGNASFSVTTANSCTWNATSNAGWITNVSPASGTGTGSAQTINYTVAANAGAARTGTITVGTSTFTVNQTALCIVTPHACCVTGSRIYVNSDVTVGTPTAVSWTLDSAAPGGDGSTLTFQSGTLWGGTRSACTLTNALRSSNGSGTTGNHTVSVTATGGQCSTVSSSITVNCP
jgi:hypothetical protein